VLKAWCSGADCETASSEDRTVEVCLTQDGIACSSKVVEAVLPGSAATMTIPQTRTPVMADWSFEGKTPIGKYEMFTRSGSVEVRGGTVSRTGGSFFSTKWVSGSKISIGGTEYPIHSVNNPIQLTVTEGPADGSYSYSATNFGIMLRKQTVSPHELSFQFARTQRSVSTGSMNWSAASASEDCSRVKTSDGSGTEGYNCMLSGVLYWLAPSTGEVRLLASAFINGVSGKWGGTACGAAGTNREVLWDTSDGNSWYCMTEDSYTGNNRLLKGTYTGNHRSVPQVLVGQSPEVAYTDLTAAKDLERQIREFSQEHSLQHVYEPEYFSCQLAKSPYRTYLAIWCLTVQNGLAWYAVFDTAANRITAAVPPYGAVWPARWVSGHTINMWTETPWMSISGQSMLPTDGTDDISIGAGPYQSMILSGLSAPAAPCPPRPEGSQIPEGDWPTGSMCSVATVDGEPCDPNPYRFSKGTIAAAPGSQEITLTGSNWTSGSGYYGSLNPTIYFEGSYYRWEKLDGTHARITPAYTGTSPYTGPYTLYAEGNINHPKCGQTPAHYLQDAEIRDNFRVDSEYVRLLMKNGNSWTLQRAYGNSSIAVHGAGSALVAIGGAANLLDNSPDNYAGNPYWSYLTDPAGQATFYDASAHTGHPAVNNGHWSQLRSTGYWIRRGLTPPEFSLDPGYYVAGNPSFGKPAAIFSDPGESHPSQNHINAPESEKRWASDARVWLGGAGEYGSGALKVTGTRDVYRVVISKTLSPKVLPINAQCGRFALRDISGPGSLINDAAPYTYCYARTAGECVTGSSAGQLFVNCPYASQTTCGYFIDGELNDICGGDLRPVVGEIIQFGLRRSDPSGNSMRLLGRALSWWKLQSPYWNAKPITDGSWWYIQNPWLNGVRNEVLLIKNPGWPTEDTINRTTFVPVPVSVRPAASLGAYTAVVEFGYDPSFRCTSRNETCEASSSGVDEAAPFHWQSEPHAGLPCASGCTIAIPAIPQRILYYRTKFRNASGDVIATGATEVVPVP
jgi:hypothetical protein